MKQPIYVVVDVGYEAESIAYMGLNWDAMAQFVTNEQWGMGNQPRIEIWDLWHDNRKPARIINPTKVERFEVPPEPTDG